MGDDKLKVVRVSGSRRHGVTIMSAADEAAIAAVSRVSVRRAKSNDGGAYVGTIVDGSRRQACLKDGASSSVFGVESSASRCA